MPSADAATVLQKLAQLESAIGALYGELARVQPDEQAFWGGLQKEEQGHARLLLGLIPLVEQGKVKFDADRFDTMAIALAHKSVIEHRAEVTAKPPCLEDALALAMSLERSLLEDSFLGLDPTGNPKVQHVLEILAKDTERHRGLIEERLKAARGQRKG